MKIFLIFAIFLIVFISGCVETPKEKEKLGIEMFDLIVQADSKPILSLSLNKPLSDKRISFYLDGKLIGSASTENGKAFFPYNQTLKAGNYTIKAVFEGDDNYSSTSTTKVLSVVKIETKIKTSDYIIYFKEDLSVDASLSSDSNAINGSIVKFYVSNKPVGSNYTNEEGASFLSLGNLKPGNYSLTAIFEGDEIYLSSNDSKNIEVTERIPAIIKAYDSIEEIGSNRTIIHAALTDYKGNLIKGQKLSFYYGKNLIGDNITTEGNASIYFNIKNLSLGSHLFTVNFRGDENYSESTAEAFITIKKEFEISGVRIYTEIPVEELSGKKINLRTDSSDMAGYCIDEVEDIEKEKGDYTVNFKKDEENNIILKAGIAQIGLKDYDMLSCHTFLCLKNNIKCDEINKIFDLLGEMENLSVILDSNAEGKALQGYPELMKSLGVIQSYLYSNGKLVYIKPYLMLNGTCILKPSMNAIQNLTQNETNNCDIEGIYIIETTDENRIYSDGKKIILKGNSNALYIEQIILRTMITPNIKEILKE